MLDLESLNAAIDKVAKEKLMREIHEWIIYTAPKEVCEIYRTYLDLVEEKKAGLNDL